MNDPAGDNPVICVVMPVFNDWAAMPRLLANLADAFRPSGSVLDIILVNDASTKPDNFAIEHCTADDVITAITILDLSVNVGHQLAITAGLHYVQRHKVFAAVLVMDADGEDQPHDAARLVAASRRQPDRLIVARRTKRSESLMFRLFYTLYRAVFRLLTGQAISFGNFMLIPANLLPSVLSRPELIHHLAATLLRTRLPITQVPTVRGQRYVGVSQMNVPALVTHAIGALSVFSDVLFSRLLIGASLVGFLCAIGSIIVACLRFFTTLAFPNWATSVISFLTLLAAQALVLILCLAFLMLTSRSAMLLTSMEVSRLVKRVRHYAGRVGTPA
jgi:glycosyltransferase involved in cell wall biosynthesis